MFHIIYLILKHQWNLNVGTVSISYSTIDCNKMPFKMGIIQFEGDSSLWASPFWNHAEVLTKRAHIYYFKTFS